MPFLPMVPKAQRLVEQVCLSGVFCYRNGASREVVGRGDKCRQGRGARMVVEHGAADTRFFWCSWAGGLWDDTLLYGAVAGCQASRGYNSGSRAKRSAPNGRLSRLGMAPPAAQAPFGD